MRDDVAFQSAGLTLRGWLYRPSGSEPSPAIVMSHGFIDARGCERRRPSIDS